MSKVRFECCWRKSRLNAEFPLYLEQWTNDDLSRAIVSRIIVNFRNKGLPCALWRILSILSFLQIWKKFFIHYLFENDNDTNFATFPLGSGLQTVKGKQKNVFAAVTKCRSCSSIWLVLVSIPSSPDCEGLPGLQDKNNIISCQLLQPFL